MVRRLDPVSGQASLRHASVKTTEGYLQARRASTLAHDVTRAFEDATAGDGDSELLAVLRGLPADQLAKLLDGARRATDSV